MGYMRLTVRSMPFETFLSSTTPYEHNRDSQKRYKKYPHLKGMACDRRREFSVAIIGERRIIVDGHSRIAAANAGVLSGLFGHTVFVTYYNVSDEESLYKLYKTFDSKTAVEKPADEVLTEQSYAGLSTLSDFTKSIAAKSTMELAYGGKDLRGANLYFKDTMTQIESWDLSKKKAPKGKKWTTGIKAAMLVSVKEYSEKDENGEDKSEAIGCLWMDYFNETGAAWSVLGIIQEYQSLGAAGNKAVKDNFLKAIEKLING